MKQVSSVLVIDDDYTSRFLVRNLLATMGIGDQVITATNGLEALELLKERCDTAHFPELVLLDIKMPKSDGFHFLEGFSKLAHANLDNTKVAILSYYGSRKLRERAMLYPVSAYFQKPLTEEKLQSVLQM